MDNKFIYVYGAGGMTEEQRKEAVLFFSGWLEKMSVACYIAGLFEPEHMFGAIISGTILFLAGLSIKVRVTK